MGFRDDGRQEDLAVTRCSGHRCHAFLHHKPSAWARAGGAGPLRGAATPPAPVSFPGGSGGGGFIRGTMFKRMAGFGPDSGGRVMVNAGPRLPSGGGCHGLAPPSVVGHGVGRFVSLSRLLSSGLNRGLKAGGESEADVTASLQPPSPPKANVITDDLEVVAEETGHLAGWGISAWCSPAPAQVIRKRGMPPPGCEDNNSGSKYPISAYRLPKEAKHYPMLSFNPHHNSIESLSPAVFTSAKTEGLEKLETCPSLWCLQSYSQDIKACYPDTVPGT